MIHFTDFFQKILAIISSGEFLLFTETIACIVATTICFLLIKTYIQHNEFTQKHNHAFYFLIFVIIGMISENIAWIVKLLNQLEIISIQNGYIKFFAMIAWILSAIRYQALGLFIENLIEKNLTFRWYQKIFTFINLTIVPIFIFNATYNINNISSCYLPPNIIYKIAPFYCIFTVIPSFLRNLAAEAEGHNNNDEI